MRLAMSAIGPKRTSRNSRLVSAFGGIATLGVLALGPIRTDACIAVKYERWARSLNQPRLFRNLVGQTIGENRNVL